MTRQLLLLRHGATPPQTPRRFLGRSDVPLADKGRAQAARWQAALSDMALDAAWCSPLARCRETARIVLAGRSLEPVIAPGLAEIDLGAWEGLSVEEVQRRFPGQHQARGRDLAGYRTPGGESFRDVARRAMEALDAMLTAAGPGPWRGLAVAHAGVNRALLCTLLGMPLERLFSLGQSHGCLNVLCFDGTEPVLAALNLPPGTRPSP